MLNTRIIASLDSNPDCRALDVAKSFSLLDALFLAKQSWESVSQQTIANCFQKAGFLATSNTTSSEDNALSDVPTPVNMTVEEFNMFITMDDNLEIVGDATNEDLLEAVRQDTHSVENEESDGDADDRIQDLTVPMKMRMVVDLRRFIQESGMFNALPMLHQVEKEVFAQVTENKKTEYTRFFS